MTKSEGRRKGTRDHSGIRQPLRPSARKPIISLDGSSFLNLSGNFYFAGRKCFQHDFESTTERTTTTAATTTTVTTLTGSARSSTTTDATARQRFVAKSRKEKLRKKSDSTKFFAPCKLFISYIRSLFWSLAKKSQEVNKKT